MIIGKVVFINSRAGVWWKVKTVCPHQPECLAPVRTLINGSATARAGGNYSEYKYPNCSKDMHSNMSAGNVFRLCRPTLKPKHVGLCSISSRNMHNYGMNVSRTTCTSNEFPSYFTKPYYTSNLIYDNNLPMRRYSTFRPRARAVMIMNNLLLDLSLQKLKPLSLIQELKDKHFSSQVKNFESHDSEEQDSFRPSIGKDTGCKKPNYLHFHPSCTPETFKEINSSFQVVSDYINQEEEEIMMKEMEPHLKRLHYEFDHWDDAIHGFRETERSRWGKAASPIISRMKKFAFPEEKGQIPQIHILDLAKTGVIKPHVDSIRFCGNIICGLCLLSDAVMRLVHVENKDQVIDIMLPRRALYIMRNDSRYKYTHELLGEKESFFNTTPVPRDRRVSILCRNNPKEEEGLQ